MINAWFVREYYWLCWKRSIFGMCYCLQCHESPIHMKRYIIVFILAALSYSVVFVVLDAIFRGLRPFMFYFGGALLFGLLSGLIMYIEEKRKNKKKDKWILVYWAVYHKDFSFFDAITQFDEKESYHQIWCTIYSLRSYLSCSGYMVYPWFFQLEWSSPLDGLLVWYSSDSFVLRRHLSNSVAVF